VWKKLCSCVFFKASIEDLFDNLEYSGKKKGVVLTVFVGAPSREQSLLLVLG